MLPSTLNSGILLVNKQVGQTSYSCVNLVKKALNISKVGHLGTLDPFADGLLIILVNKANKLGQFLEESPKRYRAVLALGYETDTLDCLGTKLVTQDVPSLTKELIIKAANSFMPSYEQTPPIYSAKKVNGKKLYEYARSNKEVLIKSCKVEIYEFELINFDTTKNEITFEMVVSRGTYIRSFGRDLAHKLNTFGTLTSLTRLSCGDFKLADAVSIDQVKNNDFSLLTPDKYIHYPKLTLNKTQETLVRNGCNISLPITSPRCSLYNEDNELLAIYELNEDQTYSCVRGII